jgi:hypothetical protein
MASCWLWYTSPTKLTDFSHQISPCFVTRCLCWCLPASYGVSIRDDRTQMGSTIDQKMVSAHGTLCMIQPRNSNQYYFDGEYRSTRTHKHTWWHRNTERCGQVITLFSYSGGPWFKSRPGDRLSWLRFFIFLSPSRQMPAYYLEISHDRFLPNPFNLLFIYHPIVPRCIVIVTKKHRKLNNKYNIHSNVPSLEIRSRPKYICVP